MTTRALGYIRVSSDMQRDGYSLDAQRRAITDACAQRGYTLAGIEADEGISARSERIDARPGLVRVLEAAKARQIDVLVVHSLDRLSRNVMATLTVFRDLAAANVAFISLSESIDYSSPEGRLQLTILGGFCAYFSDVLSKHTSKGKRERALQGRHNNLAPFGYRLEAGRLVEDPATVDAARELWRLAASGLTDHQVSDAMALCGHPLSRDTVRYLLRNRVFLGEVRWHDTWSAGQHEALIDHATWDTVQALRVAHRRSGCGLRTGSTPAVYTFGGLLTCNRCSSHFQGNDSGRNMICWGRRALSCTQPMVTDAALSRQFGELLTRLDIPETTIRAALADRPQPMPARRDAIERQLDRLRNLYRWGDMTEDAYRTETAALKAELARIDATPEPNDVVAAATRLRDVVSLWEHATKADRKTLAGSLVADLLVDDRRIVAVKPHEAWLDVWEIAQAPAERPGYFLVVA
jgi:site-specific DNA recombinase